MSALWPWLAVWVALVALITIRWTWAPQRSAGLVLAYAANLSLIHWTGAAAYALPWYQTADAATVQAGFQVATLGLVAFAVGALLLAQRAALLLGRAFPSPPTARPPDPHLPVLYVLVGLISYFVLAPAIGRLPTLNAMLAAGWTFVVVGLALGCWRAWCDRQRVRLLGWLLAGATLPLLTIVVQGFIGYGAVALLTLLAFVATFYRPRWKLLLAAALVGYGALSFYESYTRDRSAIRAVVWGRQPISARLERMFLTVADPAWFDPTDEAQLVRIDARLNQNQLVGVAIDYLSLGRQEFASGGTFWDAILALVPRALWPEKPVRAGGNQLVSKYTGIRFAEGTSVGIGQVMEFYVNFGRAGVILGFLVLGVLIATLDRLAARHLHEGDCRRFALWFLPGTAFLQVGGSLVEVTSSAGAAMATVIIVNHYLLPRSRTRRSVGHSLTRAGRERLAIAFRLRRDSR